MPSSWILNRHFTSLWLGQSISQLGDALIEVTLPIWVGLLTNDPTHVALVAATEVLPALCLGPFAGACADRWNPRTTMIVCDLVRGIFIGSLLIVSPSLVSWYIYLVSFAIAAVGSFFNPAKSVAIHLIVEEREMVRAQVLSRATQSMALIVGPALGSTLLLFFGPTVGLLCDAISFGISATSLLFLHVAPRSPSEPRAALCFAWQALWSDIADGLRFVLRSRLLIILVAVSSVAALVGHLWYAVDVFFVQSSLHTPKESVGLLWAFSGAGGLLGSLLVLLVGKRLRQEVILLTGLFVRGTSLLWYAAMTSYAWAVPAAFLAGLGDDLLMVALFSLLMEHTAHEMLGRVTALQDTTNAFTTGLSLLLVSLLKNRVSPGHLLLFCGLALCLIGLGAALGLRETRLSHPS